LRSERDPAASAVEETNAEIVLQRFHLQRDGWLCEEQMFGGFAKIQMLGDRAKDFQTKIFQLGHALIIYKKA
jgi:hypothetical protein